LRDPFERPFKYKTGAEVNRPRLHYATNDQEPAGRSYATNAFGSFTIQPKVASASTAIWLVCHIDTPPTVAWSLTLIRMSSAKPQASCEKSPANIRTPWSSTAPTLPRTVRL